LRVGVVDQVVNSGREHVLLCASGIAVNHGEIARLHAFSRNGQVVARTVRHVVGTVIRRLVVGTCINAEQ